MQISDWINVVLCIMSFVLAVVSVGTVVITLRQNHRMIENATRPYLALYGAITNFQSPQYYLVLRNFGQSSAKITKFTSSVDLSICSDSKVATPFEHIVGFSLAPNQALQVPVEYMKLIQLTQEIVIHLEYSSGENHYSETSVINLAAHADFPISRSATDRAELKIISYTLQDMAIRMM